MADLNVPVLVHAFADDNTKMTIADRRDSFCGKMSACNNLRQYDIPYSLTKKHTLSPSSPEFAEDLEWFAGVCHVVKGLRGARFGQIGARTTPFNTTRYSEKLLEQYGISVETLDLSEVLGRVERLDSDDTQVQEKLVAIKAYVSTTGIKEEALLKMARLGVVIDRWMQENELVANAIQCWTALEDYFGVVPCALMSMLSNSLIPSACETDIPGVIGMYALQLASGLPSALVDWNNNYGDDPNKAVVFHCSNLPKSIFNEAKMDYQEILAGDVGKCMYQDWYVKIGHSYSIGNTAFITEIG
jgi:L-fucose isomerase-like protein